MAQQNSIAEASANEFQNMADEAEKGPGNFDTYGGSCITITDTLEGVHRTITIDFGSTNCTCNDGKEEEGN